MGVSTDSFRSDFRAHDYRRVAVSIVASAGSSNERKCAKAAISVQDWASAPWVHAAEGRLVEINRERLLASSVRRLAIDPMKLSGVYQPHPEKSSSAGIETHSRSVADATANESMSSRVNPCSRTYDRENIYLGTAAFVHEIRLVQWRRLYYAPSATAGEGPVRH